jgi:hypothetical protein
MREDAYINEGEATRLAELTLIFIPTLALSDTLQIYIY